MASRGRSVHRLVLQQAFARAFSVRPNQLAANLEAATVSAPTAAISRSSVRVWGTLGLSFAAAGLAFAPMPSLCAPAVAVEAKPINLAIAPLPAAKLDYKIVFVLGGPGSGKGTQCSKLVEEFGLVHLSAGDLLRAHMKSGTEDGNMVASMIKQGRIVPSRVTISLLEAAMRDSGKRKFLIDGFPRNEENRSNFESQTGIEPVFVLFFDCPEEVMERRLLGRQEGRTDDNLETIRKRFKVFMDSTLPIINFYEAKGRVRRINADRSPDTVYTDVRKLFMELNGN